MFGRTPSTERSLMDSGIGVHWRPQSILLWIGRTPSRITAGPPTGMNGKHCIRAMVGRTPTRITAGPPTGMNEMDCSLASTERSLMVTMSECYVREDANPYHSWSANRNECAMVGRTPTRITAGRPTGMNEMDCIRAMIRAIKQRSLHDFPSG